MLGEATEKALIYLTAGSPDMMATLILHISIDDRTPKSRQMSEYVKIVCLTRHSL